jgi:hypothetical protein
VLKTHWANSKHDINCGCKKYLGEGADVLKALVRGSSDGLRSGPLMLWDSRVIDIIIGVGSS